MEYKYPTIDDVVGLHDKVIAESGGLSGVRDVGTLESALDHIQNDMYYPSFVDKLTHLIFSINKHHAFNDGNKRSSLSVGAYFIAENGWPDEVLDIYVEEMESVVVDVADNKLKKDSLHWIVGALLSSSYGPIEELDDSLRAIEELLDELSHQRDVFESLQKRAQEVRRTDIFDKITENIEAIDNRILCAYKMIAIIEKIKKIRFD